MKTREGSIVAIIRKREKVEKPGMVDEAEIKENLKRVMTNQPLTRPLRTLDTKCNFKKIYKKHCDSLR